MAGIGGSRQSYMALAPLPVQPASGVALIVGERSLEG